MIAYILTQEQARDGTSALTPAPACGPGALG